MQAQGRPVCSLIIAIVVPLALCELSAGVPDVTTANASYSVTPLGGNRYFVFAEQDAEGTSIVVVRGAPADELIVQCKVDLPFANLMRLQIEGKSGLPGIARLETLDFMGGTDDELRVELLNVAGDLGSPSAPNNFVECHELTIATIGGQVYTDITLFPPGVFTSTLPLASITVGGDWIGGDLECAAGDIGTINILGDIAAGASPAHFWSPTQIDEMLVGGDITGARLGVSLGNSGRPDVGLIDCDGNFSSAFNSELNGLSDLRVAGVFDTVLEVLTPLQAGHTYRIGGALVSGSAISLPVAGLAGQIIVNGSDGSGAWDGDIEVGAVTLAPNYTQSHTSLGGGAAGVVPFSLHGTDSDPLDGDSIPFDANRPGSTNPIAIRNYGPIAITGSGLSAIEFEADSGPGGVPRNDCLDSVVVGTDDTVLLVTPTAPLLNGYTYRVTTVRTDPNNRVECDLGLSPNPLVADYTYEFCVGTETPADINGDGTVDVLDFGIFAPNFASSGCFIPGDMDGDNDVDVFDFGIFAPQFGLTGLGLCSAGSEAAAPGGGAMTELFENLGFDGVADYCQWLGTLSKKEQIAEIAALFELAQEQK